LSQDGKVARLNELLKKSIAYSEFLANKIKKEGEEGVVDVQDGSVSGPGLRQPTLIQGKMRPYQLVRGQLAPMINLHLRHTRQRA
jgi:ATP-dependent DNA helicase